MKALIKTKKGKGNVAIGQIPVPIIRKNDDVLIQISAAGVCGTDIHILDDEFPYYPPVVLGHEFSGVVAETGKEVTRFKVGDRVVAEPHTCFCGVCDMCRMGNIQLCPSKRSPGWGMDGAFTDYLVMPELFIHRVPDSVSDRVAALAEPLAIVSHGVIERARLAACDTVAIIGAGTIALLSAVASKAAGAKKVFVLGTNTDEALRFPAASALGADETINVMRTDAVAHILSLTGGKGVDVVIEASGAEAGINTAVSVVKKCGRLCVLGMPGADKVSVRWSEMVRKVLDVVFCFSSSVSSWEKALSILSSTPYDLNRLITHAVRIDEWEKAFADIISGNAIKVLFIPEHTLLYFG